MWTIPIPGGVWIPDAPLLVPFLGFGSILVLLAFAVVMGLVWLISTEVRLSEREFTCPIDGTPCAVVSDRMGRLVACNPSPAHRGIDDCHGQCLAA